MAYMSTRPAGLGEYDAVKPWTWMYYPPPYAFADPRRLKAPANFLAPARSMRLGGRAAAGLAGLGCAGDCHCGGTCGGHGVGDVSTGLDFSPTSTSLVSTLAGKLGFTAPAIPNWVIYGGAAGLFLMRGR